ncbi:xanthine dehydrogenase small subunit [Vibrio gelatinilyticus]|nr:xanthine dehydrogenase small subunit [Vibrio gelatinilyticus]
MITFLLNQKVMQVDNVSPNTTVLQYLRNHTHKTGTKEGCGSGDCGACTVVLGELNKGQLQYRSVNSCLTFLSSLHGKQLITVEDLQAKDQSLHPVQQAIVDFHGSQCGYCTPGFIMSMFSLSKNEPQANKQQILESLAGNLCRCTGYRPIIDAALSIAASQPILDQFSQLESKTIETLRQIEHLPASLTHGHLTAHSPRTIEELASIFESNPQAKLVAGGTDLALEVTQLHREVDTLISVNLVDDMKSIVETKHHITIGANVVLSDAYSILAENYADFGELLHRFASLQVRNQGTIGGNIANASPIGDTPPLLIALGAQIKLRQGKQSRIIALKDYFISYKVTAQKDAEFIEQIIIPKLKPEQTFKAYKVSKRLDDDISAVCGAFSITLNNNHVSDAKIAFGGMAAVPKRASTCEHALLGQEWNLNTIEQAMIALEEDFEPLSDFRASKEYRSSIATNMLRRFFIEQQNQSNKIETRVTSYV